VQRRSELLDAAIRAIRRLGPGASMDELAREAGMTKPILYAHFGDKAGLATALAKRYGDELVPAVLEAFSGDVPPKQMVRKAIDTFIEFVEREPDVYRFLVRGVAGGSDPAFVSQELVASFGLPLAQVLRAALRSAEADTGPAEVWSFAILGAVFAGAEWWLMRPTMSRSDLVDYLATLVWGGLEGVGIAGMNAPVVELTHGT
jgi:AcrR family transcriptional regulator